MRIGVIGAGMTGLVAALRLRQAGHEVHVFEREARPGGLVAGFVPVAGGAPLEKFYHHIFKSDRAMIGLIAELGLAGDLIWKHAVTACLFEGQLHPLDSAGSLLRFSPLGILDRLRLGVALAVLKASPSVAPFERRLATAWLRSVAGSAAFETVFEPLFRSKFGSFADRVSLGWFWARIRDRTPELGYLGGSFDRFYQTLTSRILELGGVVSFGVAVSRLEADGDAIRVECASNDPGGARIDETFDRVIATVPLRVLARMAPGISDDYARRYSPVASLWAKCVVLALDRPLTGCYWISVCERGARALPFMVVVEHTNLVTAEQYAGKHLVYVGTYCEAPPAELHAGTIAELTPHLRTLNAAFSPDWVVGTWQFTAPFAQPVVTTDYRQRIAPPKTPVRGLFVANLEQVYPHDRGQNYAVELAERVVREVVTTQASQDRGE